MHLFTLHITINKPLHKIGKFYRSWKGVLRNSLLSKMYCTYIFIVLFEVHLNTSIVASFKGFAYSHFKRVVKARRENGI